MKAIGLRTFIEQCCYLWLQNVIGFFWFVSMCCILLCPTNDSVVLETVEAREKEPTSGARVQVQSTSSTGSGFRDQRLFIALSGGLIGILAARGLAAHKLMPELLARFNSSDFYQIRRKAFREMLLWFAGDRYQIVQHYGASRIPFAIGTLPPDQDPSICVSQLLGFVTELHAYHLQGLVSAKMLRHIMRDRVSWYSRYFDEFSAELGAALDENASTRAKIDNRGEIESPFFRIPFPYAQGYSRWRPSTSEWMSWCLRLRDFRAQVHLESPSEVLAAQYWTDQNIEQLKESDTRSITGLRDAFDFRVDRFKVILDTNFPLQPAREKNGQLISNSLHRDAYPRFEQSFESTKRPTEVIQRGLRGFVRLRRHAKLGCPSQYMLDYGFMTTHGFQRIIKYLDDERSQIDGKKRSENQFAESRYWFARLYCQGLILLPELTDVSANREIWIAAQSFRRNVAEELGVVIGGMDTEKGEGSRN